MVFVGFDFPLVPAGASRKIFFPQALCSGAAPAGCRAGVFTTLLKDYPCRVFLTTQDGAKKVRECASSPSQGLVVGCLRQQGTPLCPGFGSADPAFIWRRYCAGVCPSCWRN